MTAERVLCCMIIVTVFLLTTECQGQMCFMGFPSTVPQCTLDNCHTREAGGSITLIIPDMNFTCSGTVTGWRAAGVFRPFGNAVINSVLSIWRERSNEPAGTYDRTDGIELGICGSEDRAPLVMGMSNVYDCSLPQRERVSVQPGDVIGVELPGQRRVRFRLYFDNSGRSTNYIFSQSLQTFNLDQNEGTELAQPQISLTIERTAEVVPTTPFIATTSPAKEMTIQNSAPVTDLPGTIQSIATTLSTTTISDTTQVDYTRSMITIGPGMISDSTKQGTPITKSTMSRSATTLMEPTGTSISTASETIIPQEIGVNSGSSVGVVVGSLIGVITLVSLLSTIAILVLVIAYQSRKYKKDTREREARIDKLQNGNVMLDIETRPNESYIPIFRQILTEGNVAYGYDYEENRASDDGYSTIAQSTSDSMRGNAQESVTEENHYEFID